MVSNELGEIQPFERLWNGRKIEKAQYFQRKRIALPRSLPVPCCPFLFDREKFKACDCE
jgi:hypothetical protein